MCRKNHLHGCCMLAFGIGLIVGHCLESWFLCCCGGVGLIVLGFCVMRRRQWTYLCMLRNILYQRTWDKE